MYNLAAAIGTVYAKFLGQIVIAISAYEKALAIAKELYCAEHYEVARTLVNLGSAYGAMGDMSRQIELQERALKIQEKHYGAEHYEVAITLVNLGNAYGNMGNTSSRIELQERALKIKEAYYGAEYYEVASTPFLKLLIASNQPRSCRHTLLSTCSKCFHQHCISLISQLPINQLRQLLKSQ